MQVNKINTNPKQNRRPLINAKSTGYLALCSVGLATLGGVTKSKFLQKNHKVFAGISLVAIFLHLVTLNSYKWRKK